MVIGTLICATIASFAWSLWIRRVTWSSRWEVAATLNIALQGAAVLLMCPFSSATIGVWLHSVLHEWNFEDYLGHDCYIVAASAVCFNIAGRLHDKEEEQRKFKLWVETPATLCIPILLVLFSESRAVGHYYPDFLRAPCGHWMFAYWILLCSILIWLLTYSLRMVLILRRDPRNRTVGNFYLFAMISGLIATGAKVVISFLPKLDEVTFVASFVVWLFACGCGAGFALGSAHSWGLRKKWFTAVR